jgi:hypothetical protein
MKEEEDKMPEGHGEIDPLKKLSKATWGIRCDKC